MRKKRSTFAGRVSKGTIASMLAVFAAQAYAFSEARLTQHAAHPGPTELWPVPAPPSFDFGDLDYEVVGFTATTMASSGSGPGAQTR